MWIERKEYGALCHAIRSIHANKIPSEGFLLYKDSFYVYNHNMETHKITFTAKMKIAGNEEKIAIVMKGEA